MRYVIALPLLCTCLYLASCGGTVEPYNAPGAPGGSGGAGGATDGGVGGTGGTQPGGSGGWAGTAAGGAAGTGGSAPCGPNPAGCFSNGVGCPMGTVCAALGCTPSYCQCDPDNGTWMCTNDCGGGTCVPSEDGGAPKYCGGWGGGVCAFDEWCDYEASGGLSYCGADDGSGICRKRPVGCDDDCPGTCGCDSNFYCNACLAHANGTDDAAFWGCGPSVDGGAPDAGSDDCYMSAQNIAASMSDMVCTAVVRVDYTGMFVKAWQFVCGGFAQLDEAKARSMAQAETGFGQAGTLLSGPAPADAWVFLEAPSDFGGVGVVSARSARSVFGGSIVWAGSGELTFPKQPWNPGVLLGGAQCSSQMLPTWRGFDLGAGPAHYSSAGAGKALTVATSNALLLGISHMQYVTDAVVLLYPRSVGDFNPATAEWIVLINSQWLE